METSPTRCPLTKRDAEHPSPLPVLFLPYRRDWTNTYLLAAACGWRPAILSLDVARVPWVPVQIDQFRVSAPLTQNSSECCGRAAVAVGFDHLPDRAVQLIAQHVEFRERCAPWKFCHPARALHGVALFRGQMPCDLPAGVTGR